MNIRINKGTIAAIATASLFATAASATQQVSVRDLGSAAQVRNSIMNKVELNNKVSVYAADAPTHAAETHEGHEHDDKEAGEGKCGEGKCGEGKCGEGKDGKAAEGKCGEGKCGEGKDGKAAEATCGEKKE
ncbi:MAG: hypothetical protein SGJ02_06735 [bacterium]|nr:hypothetical protein [bacterium]